MEIEAKKGFEPSRRQFLTTTGLIGVRIVLETSVFPRAVAGIFSAPTTHVQPLLTQNSALEATLSLINEEIDYDQGRGRQSIYWQEATNDLSSYFGSIDLVDQAVNGDQALVFQRGAMGDRIRAAQLRQLESTPSQFAGLCFQTAIAMGDCPIIQGPKSEFGVTMSYLERMLLAPHLYNGCRELIGWGRTPKNGPYTQNVEERGVINQSELQYIMDIFNANQSANEKLVIVIDTAKARHKDEEEWWTVLTGFSGESFVCTDILGWNGIRNSPTRLNFGPFHFSLASRVVLVDPNQPQPGAEDGFYNIVNRPLAKVFLNKAEIS